MTFRVEVLEKPENYKAYANLEGITVNTRRAVRRGMFAWGKDLKSTANTRILARDKTGRIYIRRDSAGRRRRHQASAPGEYHANRTGAARKSIQWTLTGFDRLEFGYGVNTGVFPDYVRYLEFGTRTSVPISDEVAGPRQFRTAPRPSIQNAINDTTGNAETYFDRELEKLEK